MWTVIAVSGNICPEGNNPVNMVFSKCKRFDLLAMTVVANNSLRYAEAVFCRELKAYKCVHNLVLIQQSTVPCTYL